ncbi:MAG: TIGR04282 family arsenosugar biosynthesis glycosyltransferase [Alcanivoracaceae bacterium]|nr:TIGR04282 family arsenosugar biosynthesis glycosyltransferase [Alcanivoracaceae bacterium]
MTDPRSSGAGCAIAVFARPPRLGQVKTRLAAAVGDETALNIYRQLLEHTLRQVSISGLPFTLFAAAQSDELAALAHCYKGEVALQHGDDLGERMAAAFSEMHNLTDAVILIGTDCPVLTAGHLLAAQQMLLQSEVVLGPAEDGGYWLIGSANDSLWRNSSVFDGVQFGGSQALAMTVHGLQRAGVSASMLPVLWDLDTEQDYQRARSLGML